MLIYLTSPGCLYVQWTVSPWIGLFPILFQILFCPLQHGGEITDHNIFWELTRYWENEYHKDMKALNVCAYLDVQCHILIYRCSSDYFVCCLMVVPLESLFIVL